MEKLIISAISENTLFEGIQIEKCGQVIDLFIYGLN